MKKYSALLFGILMCAATSASAVNVDIINEDQVYAIEGGGGGGGITSNTFCTADTYSECLARTGVSACAHNSGCNSSYGYYATSCKTGYKLSNGSCVELQPCTNTGSCLEFQPCTYTSKTACENVTGVSTCALSGSCYVVSTCDSGYYKNGTSCSPCKTGCATCSNSTTCTSCSFGTGNGKDAYYASAGDSTSVECSLCWPDFTGTDVCMTPNAITCTFDERNCPRPGCMDGYTFAVVNGQPVCQGTTCADGYEMKDGKCVSVKSCGSNGLKLSADGCSCEAS